MKVYICRCGFFGFSRAEDYQCGNCHRNVIPTQEAELNPVGMAKYQAITEGLKLYEEERCGRLQITLFG